MKISLNWLRELVELPPTTNALVDLLTLAGVEVEGIETHGVAIPNVVVAQIRESVQHPNADRLSVCQVDDGSGVARQIVCGAKNYVVGDKVPLALPGAVLGPDFKIKVGKLRGVESQGMLCSADELGLPKGADGLLILPPDATPGAPLSELFPGDTILDLEITPNRPDLLSVHGIAREIGALTGKPWGEDHSVDKIESGVPVSVSVDAAACPVYTVRRIADVTVGSSPAWLRQKLEAVGLRSINNIVDVTNFVMLELGQPLHAFDADKLSGDIRVRTASAGEEFASLDGRTYRLAAEQVVIADGSRALALGGVMGGAESGVTDATKTILLESAIFDPATIRRTSRGLGLASDSSYRFERGVDRAGVSGASQRAAALIVELAGGTAGSLSAGFSRETPFGAQLTSAVVDMGGAVLSHEVALRHSRVERLLGVDVPPARIDTILTGFGLQKADGDRWHIPSWRQDLTREIDLIEEIARVVGMDIIPAKTHARFAPASATDRAYDRAMDLRRALVAHGLHEARSLTLVSAEPRGAAFTQTAPGTLQRVKNPMIDDQVVLRPNLLHGLLEAVSRNIRAGAKTIRLFEIGRTFSTLAPEEFAHAALVLSGPARARTWRGAESPDADLYALKGIVAAVIGHGVTFEPEENPALALSLAIKVNGQPFGLAGQLWPADSRALDGTAPVLFAELDLAALQHARTAIAGQGRYREIPRFPATSRDIALLAPRDLAHASVERVLRTAEQSLLAHIELFDLFTDPTGEKLPADKKSLAYSLTYRAQDRTLTADEVNAAHGQLRERLKAQLGVTFRE